MTRGARTTWDAKSDSRANANIAPAEKASTEELKNSYAVKKLFENSNLPTGTHCIVCWFGYGPQSDTIEPTGHITHHFRELYWRTLPKGKKKLKPTRRERQKMGNKSSAKKTASKRKILIRTTATTLHRSSRLNRHKKPTREA